MSAETKVAAKKNLLDGTDIVGSHLNLIPIGKFEKTEERNQLLLEFYAILKSPPPEQRWYTFHEEFGGLNQKIDSAELIGKKVAGYFNPVIAKSGDKDRPFQFYAGTIEEAKFVKTWDRPFHSPEQAYELTIRSPKGHKIQTEFFDSEVLLHGDQYLNDRLYFLEAAIPEELILKKAFDKAQFKKIISSIFGEPLQEKDLLIAQIAGKLFLNLPSNYGLTAVVKLLRGQKVNVPAEFEKWRGFVANDKRYGPKQIENWVKQWKLFTINQEILGVFFGDGEASWLGRKQFTKKKEALILLLDGLVN